MAHIRRAEVFIEWGRYEAAQFDLDAAREVIESRHMSNWRVAGDEAETRILLEVRRARPDAAQAASVRWRAAGKVQSEDELTDLRFGIIVAAAQGQWAQAKAQCEAALAMVKKGSPVRDVPVLTEGKLKV